MSTDTRLSNPGRRRPAPLAELCLMAGVFLAYRQIRFLSRNDTDAAMDNARRVVNAERWLGMFREGAVQDLALRSDVAVGLLNRYYVGVHFPLTIAFLVWVLVRHPHAYRRIRTWFITVTLAALVVHVAFPLAPPRMLADHGFVDTLRVYGPNIYTADTSKSVANQFAAMPSLHFGWAAMVAIGFVSIRRSRRSLLVAVHPLVTLLAIVATANHYWLDAAVAGVLVVLGAVACRAWYRPRSVALRPSTVASCTTHVGVPCARDPRRVLVAQPMSARANTMAKPTTTAMPMREPARS